MHKKNGAIELLRFALALIVCIYHFRKYNNGTIFEGGYLCVDFFFVISGFMLMKHFRNNSDSRQFYTSEEATIKYSISRYGKLFPQHAFAWIVLVLVSSFILHRYTIIHAVTSGIYEFFLIQITGLGIEAKINAEAWYISSLLFASLLVYWLASLNEKRYIYLIAPIVSITILGWIYQRNGVLDVWSAHVGFMCIGFWRGLAEVMIGSISFKIYESIKFKFEKRYMLTSTIFQILGFSLFFLFCCFGRSKYDFIIPFLAGMLTISLSIGNSYLNVMLDNDVSRYLGNLSYAIYLNQLTFQLLFSHLLPGLSFWPITIVLLVCLIIFSVFSTWFVEALTRYIKDLRRNLN